MKKYKILHVGLCVQPPPINDMQAAFIENSIEYRELSTGDPNVNANTLKIAFEFKPDIVFFQIQAPGIVTSETVRQLKLLGAKVYNWTGDVRDPLPAWFKTFGADVTLFSNMRDVREMTSQGFNSDFLEIGYDPNIYTAGGPVTSVPPVVFFGNSYGTSMFPMSKFRMDMAIYLRSEFGSKFGVYGHGWSFANGNFNNSQREEAAAYRGSKIAINCSHFEIERYSSDRLLRILGTGTPICLAKYYPGLELDYEDKVHLRVWRSFDELKGLINYYLDPANEIERREIALNGMIHAKEKFTFDQMAKNLIKIHEKWNQ